MSKEIVTKCDACASRLNYGERPVTLTTGPKAEGEPVRGKHRRHLRQHDICRNCLYKFAQYLVGIMLFGRAIEVGFDRQVTGTLSDTCKDSGLIAALICNAARHNPDATHRMLCHVICFGGVEDRISEEAAD